MTILCVGYIPARERRPATCCPHGQHTRKRLYRGDLTRWLGTPQYDCECGSSVSETQFQRRAA